MTTVTATQALDMSQLTQQFANFGTPSVTSLTPFTSVTLHSSALNIDAKLTGTLSAITGAATITINTIHVESPPGSTAYDISDLSLAVPITFNLSSVTFTFPDPLALLAGGDSLVGSDFNDVLLGLGGNDVLLGNDGSDTLRGGLGKDTMDGGIGIDFFDFDSKKDSVKGVDRDTILNFTSAAAPGLESDLIDLRTIDAVKGPHNQHFKYIGAHHFHHIAGELQVKYGATAHVGIVSGDIDGNGKADFQIEVDSAFALAKGDFLL
jgi:Ca2+-binding RTX toxin-like protein